MHTPLTILNLWLLICMLHSAYESEWTVSVCYSFSPFLYWRLRANDNYSHSSFFSLLSLFVVTSCFEASTYKCRLLHLHVSPRFDSLSLSWQEEVATKSFAAKRSSTLHVLLELVLCCNHSRCNVLSCCSSRKQPRQWRWLCSMEPGV